MDPALLASLTFLCVLVLIGLRVPIAFGLFVPSFIALAVFYGWPAGGSFNLDAGLRPALAVVQDVPFEFAHNYTIATIPLYIALGYIAHRAEITTDIFRSMRVLMAGGRGGMAVASVVGCGGFSAISGSSVACAAAMGRIAVPEMLRHGYSPRLATGSVAVGGTLGSMIPPSIPFILFAVLAEQSVAKLLLAGIIPGLLTLLGYIVTINIWVRLRPGDAPTDEAHHRRDEVVAALVAMWPALFLVLLIVGGIFLGIFNAIQAAAVSAVAAAIIGFARRNLDWKGLIGAMRETVVQTAALFAIAFGAKILVALIAATNLSGEIVAQMQAFDLPPWAFIAVVVVVLIIMGMFLDPIGILLLMVPVTLPVIEGFGFHVIWYAVVFVKLLEIGLITPPIGLNAFVIKAAAGTATPVRIEQVFAGILRFLPIEFVVLLLIMFIPALSLFIPGVM